LVELLSLLMVGVLLLQALLSGWFALLVRRRLSEPAAEAAWPAAEVVLCLRGVDPALPATLAALAAQRYGGAWCLLLLVDGERDPAWQAAAGAIAQLEAAGAASWRAARLSALAEPPRSGSRKSAALRQAFAALQPATELVALVDADAVVRSDWLAALARGCLRPGVGAAGGNRWYLPARRSGAGMVRAIWNGGALVLMTLFSIPWGGSLAVRRQLIEPSGWRDVLERSLCEDTALTTPLRRSGWRFRFGPELIALDRNDSIALRPLVRWIARQLLTARLHHPAWPLVALHGLGTSLLLLSAVLVVLGLVLSGDLAGALRLTLVLLGYELGCGLLLLGIQRVVAAAIPLDQRLPLGLWLRWLPLAQLVYGVATLRAQLARRVEWSGVVYRVVRQGRERGVQAVGIEAVEG
jgi:hypothetical protein